MEQVLPVFSFPTSIVCVDDNQLFLKSITHQLGKNSNIPIKSIKTFNSPKECLSFLKDYKSAVSSKDFICGNQSHEIQDHLGYTPINIDFSKLHKLNSEDVSREISILIIDFDMPGMNGLELCRQLKNFPAKKILLTGRVELSQPVEAFNNGIIDCYLNKESKDLINELAFHIERLSKNYFIDKTRILLEYLDVSNPSHLSDPVFADFFFRLCQKEKTISYCVVDNNGSILMRDQNGNTSYLIVYTKKSLNDFLNTYDDEEFSEIRAEILNEGKIPFFGIQVNPLKIETSLWRNHLYQWDILNGTELYYWSLVRKNKDN